jgi:hypothetical protein
MRLQVTDNYYEHVPERVMHVNGTTTTWDVPVVTDRTITTNRPDIHCTIKKENSRLLIDVDTPNDSNFITKETEKLSKYKDPEIEFSRMWKVRTEIVPVIIRAFRTIKR